MDMPGKSKPSTLQKEKESYHMNSCFFGSRSPCKGTGTRLGIVEDIRERTDRARDPEEVISQNVVRAVTNGSNAFGLAGMD
jgi:hypothetical protein